MNLVILVLIVHFIADFLFQDPKWATEKSTSIKALLKHTGTYSIVTGVSMWLGFIVMYGDAIGTYGLLLWYSIIAFIFHTITDFITSKIVSKKFGKKQFGTPIPNTGAFSVIGFDQLLHYIQLLITLQLLIDYFSK